MDPAAEFASITGSDVATARQYLDSCGGDLNAAIASFLDAGGVQGSQSAQGFDQPPQPSAASQSSSAAASKRTSRKKASGGPRTLSDLRGDSSDSDDDTPQQKYTGGAASGMMVEDHPRDKKPKSEVQSLFDRASKEGVKHAEEHAKANANASSSSVFRGGGYALGDSESGSRAVPAPGSGTGGDDGDDDGEKMVKITFWRGGFTVDEGPFRALDAPENAEFLSAINRGFVPRELGNRNIAISLEDRRKDDYVPPAVEVKPFQGGGQRLGTTMEAPGATASSAPASSSSSSSAGTVAAESGADPSKGEVTSIQIRLHDGTRLVAKFNLSQTVGDIRRFINASRPECAAMAYDLQLTFPRKLLEDNGATVEAAGLKGAVIVQAKK